MTGYNYFDCHSPSQMIYIIAEKVQCSELLARQKMRRREDEAGTGEY